MRRNLSFGLLWAFLGSVGCSGPNEAVDAGSTQDAGLVDGHVVDASSLVIHASDYDQSCAIDSDCAAIYEGDICADCIWANAAIRASEVSREAHDATQLAAQCPPRPSVSCGVGAATRPRCTNHRCALEICDRPGACEDDAGSVDAGTAIDASSDAADGG